MVSYPNQTVPGQASKAVYQYLVHILSPVSESVGKRGNGRRKFFMTKPSWKNVPDVGIELVGGGGRGGHLHAKQTRFRSR